MRLRFVPLEQQGKDISKTKFLFETAFSKEERPPFSFVLKIDHRLFYAIYDEETFVGLIYLLECKDLLYVFFLAISKRYRNKGYGMMVLGEIRRRYEGRRIFLLADEPTPEYEDYELRKRRIGFYARNGFVDSNLVITEYGSRYHLLSDKGVSVTEKEFLETMMGLIGKERMEKYYPAFKKYWG